MGKGLIGNSIPDCMQDILRGEVLIDDIDVIYTNTYFSKEDIPNLIDRYQDYWEFVASCRSERNVAEKYGLSSIDSVKEDDEFERLYAEARQGDKEIEESLKPEIEKLFYELYDSGKIVQTKYRVPEGQTEIATVIKYNGDIIEKKEVNDKEENLMKINGQLYLTNDGGNVVYGELGPKWSEDKEDFIATQLPVIRGGELIKVGILKKLFPEYETMITKISDILIQEYGIDGVDGYIDMFDFDITYKDVRNLIKQQKETISHTPSEVVEMAEKIGLTQSVVDEVSNEMIGEKEKVDPSIQDNDNNGSHDDHDDA